MKIFIFTLLISVYALGAVQFKCETNEKFKKAYNFISHLKNVDLKKDEIVAFSTELASKCHDTIKRFDSIFDITESTDLSVKNSIVLSIRIALNKDIDISNLNKIFKYLIDPKGPDLPYVDAIKYAEEFSAKGKYSFNLLKDVYNFCINKQEINKTKAACIELAQKVLTLGIKKSDLLEKSYNYLTEDKYIKIPSEKAIDFSLNLLKYGDKSFDDFKDNFDFAISKRGVDVSRDEALSIALGLLDKSELSPEALKINEKEEKEKIKAGGSK